MEIKGTTEGTSETPISLFTKKNVLRFLKEI